MHTQPNIPLHPAALAAALLAFASAAVTLYWTAGGTALLDTVGGTFEDLARERSAGAVALGAVIVALKVAAGMLALAISGRPPRRPGRRLLARSSVAGGVLLALYGGVLVIAGALVLSGAIDPAGEVDEHALRWHVFVWDLWFALWGIALADAGRAFSRRAA